MNILVAIKRLLKSPIRIIALLVIVAIIGFLGWKFLGQNQAKPQYQTTKAQKGTLVTSISASGQITSSNNISIATGASGTVNNVYVKNGDQVVAGQKIADLTLDQTSLQKQAAAWSSYLQARSSYDSSQTNLNTLQSTEFTANQKFINDAVARNLITTDPTYIEENAAWKAAEANYINQQGVIAQSQAALSSSWLAYQQTSATITAPSAGTVSNLTLVPGLTVSTSSSSSSSASTATTTQSLGSIKLDNLIQAKVNVSEIDSVNVVLGQKVTLTLDAFPGKTFAGKVVNIDTTGVVSSGVTNYPAIISLDSATDRIYPNMAVNAKIITNVKNNILLVPLSAVSSQGGQGVVRILNNGQVEQAQVVTGDSSDTQTEIISGINEGENVITSTISTTSGTGTGNGSSVFGSRPGGAGGRGGGGFSVTGGRGG